MKHKNMKQYEEKNAPKLNHDITLEEIEAACRAHQKENDNRNCPKNTDYSLFF